MWSSSNFKLPRQECRVQTKWYQIQGRIPTFSFSSGWGILILIHMESSGTCDLPWGLDHCPTLDPSIRLDWVSSNHHNHFFKNSRSQIKVCNWNLFFFISQLKHILWVLKRTVTMKRSVTENYFFLFPSQNICCGCSKEPSQWDVSFEHPKHMFKQIDKEKITILR